MNYKFGGKPSPLASNVPKIDLSQTKKILEDRKSVTPLASNAPSQDIKSQLKTLGVNTQEVDTKVSQEIQQTQAKKISQADFFSRLNALEKANPGKSKQEIYKQGVKLASEKGYIVDGVDLKQEMIDLGLSSPGSTSQTQDKSGVDMKGIMGLVRDTLVPDVVQNAFGGITGTAAKSAGNIAGFGADVLTQTPVNAFEMATGKEVGTGKELGDFFRSLGEDSKTEIQQAMGTDPESFLTQASEFGTEVGLLFTPSGQASLVSKFPQSAGKIKILGTALDNAKDYAPKIYSALKTIGTGAARGAEEAAKFGVVSEGEISPESAAIGGVAGGAVSPLLNVTTKPEITMKIKEKLGQVLQKVSKNKATSVKAVDAIGDETARGLQIIKARNPDVQIKGENAVMDIAEISGKTRMEIGAELEKTRGFGGVDLTDTLKWFDDMISVARNPQMLKQKSAKFKKEYKTISNLGNLDDIAKALETRKNDLMARLKNNKTSITGLDEYIIGINRNVASLYNNASNSSARTSLVIDDAANSKMKEMLDKTISENTPGAGEAFRKLKSEYKSVLNAEKNMANIYSKVLSKKPVSLTDYTDVFIYGNLMEALATGGTASAAKAGLQLGIRNKLTKMGDPNNIVSDIWSLMSKGQEPISSQVSKTSNRATKIGVASGLAGEKVSEITE